MCVLSASVAADYLKIRGALESYPRNLGTQLQELYVKRKQCDIRTKDQPSLDICHAETYDLFQSTPSIQVEK